MLLAIVSEEDRAAAVPWGAAKSSPTPERGDALVPPPPPTVPFPGEVKRARALCRS